MRLAIECAAAAGLRNRMKAEGKLTPLPPESARAADSLYRTTVLNLWQGVKGRAK